MSDQTSTEVQNPQAPAPPPIAPGELVGVKHGQFGKSGGPDTSGYAGLVREVRLPAPAQPPFGGWYDEVDAALRQHLPAPGYEAMVEAVIIDRGEMAYQIRREHLPTFLRTARDATPLRFELCLGATGVHFPQDEGRQLHVTYPLLSITHNRRVRVQTTCPDDDRHIPSATGVYPTNDWHEREVWDMFGVIFDGHPGLTRILMPDDWAGHPQRKDYPLGGIAVEFKGASIPAPDTRRSGV